MAIGNSTSGAASLLMAVALSREDHGDPSGISSPEGLDPGRAICPSAPHSIEITPPTLDTLTFHLAG